MISFENFLTKLGSQEGQKFNECHEAGSGRFCSGGGAGGVNGVIDSVMTNVGGTRIKPKILLNDTSINEQGGSGERGAYNVNSHTIMLGPKASGGLEAYANGDRSDNAIDGLHTLAHEAYHSQSPAYPKIGESFRGFEEGLVEYKAQNLVKSMTGKDVPRPAYSHQVAMVKFVQDEFGPKIYNKLWDAKSEGDRVKIVKPLMREWVEKTLVKKGADPLDAKWVSKQIKKPEFILYNNDWGMLSNPKSPLKNTMRTLSVVREYKVPVDWRNY